MVITSKSEFIPTPPTIISLSNPYKSQLNFELDFIIFICSITPGYNVSIHLNKTPLLNPLSLKNIYRKQAILTSSRRFFFSFIDRELNSSSGFFIDNLALDKLSYNFPVCVSYLYLGL